MKTKLISAVANVVIMFVLVSASYAQGNGGDVYWHIDPGVESCSMVIDHSLTQAQWKTFVEQVAAISASKVLASAEPLGKMRFHLAIDYSRTPIDQHDPAWINTFTHPDAECPLGDAIAIPTLRASMGLSDNMDVGAFWTKAPDGNYGMAGGEIKYAFLRESENLPAAAVRGSVSILTGVSDYDLNVYSVELMASKNISLFTPYAGFRESVAIGTETTSKVNLDKESPLIAQGYAGVTRSIWMFNIVAEYNVSTVNTLTFLIGFNF